jgi:hypothetical protein
MNSSNSNSNSKTYGRGKLRINLNSPRGNIYAVWGVALNLMQQCLYSKEEINKTLAELKVGKYEDCLKAFGDHKVFGSLFKLYYSPEYMMDWDEGEWGNPNEVEDSEEEESDSEEEESDSEEEDAVWGDDSCRVEVHVDDDGRTRLVVNGQRQ